MLSGWTLSLPPSLSPPSPLLVPTTRTLLIHRQNVSLGPLVPVAKCGRMSLLAR